MDLFKADHAIVADTSSVFQVLNSFINQTKGDIFLCQFDLNISRHIGFIEILNKIKALLIEPRSVSYTFSIGTHVITGKYEGIDVLITIDTQGRNYNYEPENDDDDNDAANKLRLSVFSAPLQAQDVAKAVKQLFDEHHVATVCWWYQGSHGPDNRQVYLPRPETKLRPEYYPDLGDPYAFMDEYLKSNSSVLLMAGPPGTGKTTLLRHMIIERKLTAHIIYDEKLMANDSIFQRFLFTEDADIMIIEDADTILLGRDDDGNKMMARFLSISDGLIKLPNKKLVFTTNLTDFSKVDQALLRPGRCHAVVHTRPLNLTEAQAAAKVAELPEPTQKGEYTLAELFNQRRAPTLRKIGFGG